MVPSVNLVVPPVPAQYLINHFITLAKENDSELNKLQALYLFYQILYVYSQVYDKKEHGGVKNDYCHTSKDENIFTVQSYHDMVEATLKSNSFICSNLIDFTWHPSIWHKRIWEETMLPIIGVAWKQSTQLTIDTIYEKMWDFRQSYTVDKNGKLHYANYTETAD